MSLSHASNFLLLLSSERTRTGPVSNIFMDQGEEVLFASYTNRMNTLFLVDSVPLCEPDVS